MTRLLQVLALVLVVFVAACGDDDVVPADGGRDAGRADAGPDDAAVDAGDVDAGPCPDDDGDGVSTCAGDCDDADASRYPSATELCDYGGHDEDCNTATYGAKDDDSDGYVDARCCNGSACGLDCDDTRGGVHPALPEVCNQRDDDCNGVIDDDSQVEGYRDADRDLYGAGPLIMACAGSGLSVNGTDCDDTSPDAGSASPAFREVPGDGIDNDCDGTVDGAAGPAQLWYRDADGDGFGVATDTQSSIAAPPGYALLAGDCADADSARNPRAVAVCNGLDDDCDGQLDFIAALGAWEDDDGDGFLNAACGGAADDCDDRDRSTHTGAAEVCDGRDNDCDSAIDESVCAMRDAGVPVDMGPTDGGVPAPAITYIKASNTTFADYFGYAVALSADGTRLAVGAFNEDSDTRGVDGAEDNDFATDSGAVYVFVLTGTTWIQEAYIKASNTDPLDEFGRSVSLSADGTRLVVGAVHEGSGATGVNGMQDDETQPGSGAAYVFVRAGSRWTQEAYVKASNTGTLDRFGASVSLSTDGSRLAVSAPQEASSATGVNGNQSSDTMLQAGAVYVFLRTGSTWAQEAYIKASNTGAEDYFGENLSLSGDGSRLVVGAAWEDSSAIGVNPVDGGVASEAGAAYVYSRTGTTWVHEAYVKASNTDAFDFFGRSVSLTADGSRLAVGAETEASSARGIGGDQLDNSADNAGAVYVFTRAGTTWTQEAYIKASNTGSDDTFGWSVAFSPDGTRLAVGAPQEGSNARGLGGDQSNNAALNSGAVYVFSRAGVIWSQDLYVKSSNTAEFDYYGKSVSLAMNGRRLATGAEQEDSNATGVNGDQANNDANESGAVYVY